MSPSHLNLDKARRVSFTLGAAIAVSFFLAGAGVTWGTMRSDLTTVRSASDDHEKRLRTLEQQVVQGLAEIRTELRTINGKNP